MILAALTPDAATSNFNAWIAAGVSMITTLCLAAAVVLPKIAALKAQVETLFNLHRANSDAITTLAIHTPTPGHINAPAVESLAAALEANTLATEADTAAQPPAAS